MDNLEIKALILVTVLLSGCVTSHPQNAEEFRRAVPGAFSAKVETFDVDRPFQDVARTFQNKATECLSMRIKSTTQSNTMNHVVVSAYKPTVLVNAQRAELHLQQHHERGVMNVTKEPGGGYYIMVTDAYPVDKKRTRIEMFRPTMGYDTLISAVKGWATGKNLGCPDMTKG
jgi:hypothetical protein